MPFIENTAAADIGMGYHQDPGDNAMLIQIMDPASSWWPTPKYTFKEVHKFEFLDIEKNGLTNTGTGEMSDLSEFAVTDVQAFTLVQLLRHALDNDMNVIVHCLAGICRSGAVTEVGVMMGFKEPDRFRNPNMLVKHKMMAELGWTYDENEESSKVLPLPTDFTK